MALDGDKLKAIRTSKNLSQEKLAAMSNVDRRTIQRAEQGAPVALETAAFIAAALEVNPTSIRGKQAELFEAKSAGYGEVVLVPVTSGRKLIDTIRRSFEAQITYDVEPMHDNIDLLAKLSSLLSLHAPDPWRSPYDDPEFSQSDILKSQADVNELFPELAGLGIGIYMATYKAQRAEPRLSDEGQMYIPVRATWENVEIAVVEVSDSSALHLTRQRDDIHYGELTDEIPF